MASSDKKVPSKWELLGRLEERGTWFRSLPQNQEPKASHVKPDLTDGHHYLRAPSRAWE